MKPRGFAALRSRDSRTRSWVTQTTPTPLRLYVITFVDAQHGWAVGWHGTIVRSVSSLLLTITDVPGGSQPGTAPARTPLASLQGASPNPFNPMTEVGFTLAHAARVRLQVFDLTGRRVGTLAEDEMSAGRHEVRFAPRELASGTYLLRLDAGREVHTSKLTLVR